MGGNQVDTGGRAASPAVVPHSASTAGLTRRITYLLSAARGEPQESAFRRGLVSMPGASLPGIHMAHSPTAVRQGIQVPLRYSNYLASVPLPILTLLDHRFGTTLRQS